MFHHWPIHQGRWPVPGLASFLPSYFLSSLTYEPCLLTRTQDSIFLHVSYPCLSLCSHHIFPKLLRYPSNSSGLQSCFLQHVVAVILLNSIVSLFCPTPLAGWLLISGRECTVVAWQCDHSCKPPWCSGHFFSLLPYHSPLHCFQPHYITCVFQNRTGSLTSSFC